jgi:hypothetical protein
MTSIKITMTIINLIKGTYYITPQSEKVQRIVLQKLETSQIAKTIKRTTKLKVIESKISNGEEACSIGRSKPRATE